ncbi:rRNA-processing protein EBP2 [Cyphellophora attinorum]|uniref:rRNA-processing protein EBP2 n=1 Tax=Cyphellophora attinorum TaxID=1664694 RepID=A0A0N0NKY2_9EURO|nr:rRNA-processing protein EBP2 [Phialophora attinorum]KPI38379.1 rRNA-processing protein EBP2 [Phialophora attinorum]
MVKKSKLLAALDAHKGRDYDAEKRKKQLKAGEKAKQEKLARKAQSAKSEDEAEPMAQAADIALPESEDEAEEVDDITTVKFNGEPTTQTNGQDVASEGDDSDQDGDEDQDDEGEEEEEEEEDDDEAGEEEDIALSDLSASDREDTVPHQRMTINNGPALLTSTSRIALLRNHPLKDRAPFSTHNSLISTLPSTTTSVPDPNDDLTRESAFYAIARAAASEARSLLKKENIPFSRPADYFAEMVKSEEHMGRIHKKQYDEAADRKGREEARKLRDAKKFGKQVQVAKEQERAKLKRETLDKIKDLKRKRKGNPSENTKEDAEDDLFDVGVDDDNNDSNKSRRGGRDRSSSRGGAGGAFKRQKKDAKFGFGGKKRFSKSGDAESSADMRGFSSARMKGRGGGGGRGGAKRLGKSRRAAGRP